MDDKEPDYQFVPDIKLPNIIRTKKSKILLISSALIIIFITIIIIIIISKSNKKNEKEKEKEKEEEKEYIWGKNENLTYDVNGKIENSFKKGGDNYNEDIGNLNNGLDYEKNDRNIYDLYFPENAEK